MTDAPVRYLAGGGLGDALFILGKWRALAPVYGAGPLTYVMTRGQAEYAPAVESFFAAQGIRAGVRLVDSVDPSIRSLRREGFRVLNVFRRGYSVLQPWKRRTFPFDAPMPPRLALRGTLPGESRPYVLVQAQAGTMPSRCGKNWLSTGWIESWMRQVRDRTGARMIVIGTETRGLQGGDRVAIHVPMKELIGWVSGASLVLGLQGFVAMAACLAGVPVMLKRENVLVISNHVDPAWRPRLLVFREPRRPEAAWVDRMSAWATPWLMPGGVPERA